MIGQLLRGAQLPSAAGRNASVLVSPQINRQAPQFCPDLVGQCLSLGLKGLVDITDFSSTVTQHTELTA